jgi:hypothetical protein
MAMGNKVIIKHISQIIISFLISIPLLLLFEFIDYIYCDKKIIDFFMKLREVNQYEGETKNQEFIKTLGIIFPFFWAFNYYLLNLINKWFNNKNECIHSKIKHKK